MSSSESCKAGASKSKSISDGVCDVNDMLNNMSTGDNNVAICANCGKEGDDINNMTFATNVNKSSIAMLRAKRSTDQNIKSNVKDG